jgi:acyl carrier protein
MSDALIGVFSEGLKLDASGLSDDTSPENTSEWDSLASMTLVMLLEDTFDVRLSTKDILSMSSIGAARAVLQAKGVEGI